MVFFLFQVAGIALIVIGTWFLVDDKAMRFVGVAGDEQLHHTVNAAAITILIVGLCSLLIGVIGCWGALKEWTACLIIVSINHCLLKYISELVSINHVWCFIQGMYGRHFTIKW